MINKILQTLNKTNEKGIYVSEDDLVEVNTLANKHDMVVGCLFDSDISGGVSTYILTDGKGTIL